MKKWLIVFVIILLTSCRASKEEVVLKIINKDIHYIALDDSLLKRITYKNDRQRDESFNVIRFKIINNTNKKLLFFVRDLEIANLDAFDVNITENGKTLKGINSLPHYTIYKDSCNMNLLRKKEEDFSNKFAKLGIDNSLDFWAKYQSQTIVMNPDEVWEFSTLISLPLIVESDLLNILSPYYYNLKEGENYKFSLEYSIDNRVMMELTSEQLKELKSNNIEVFAGKINSNEIELLPKH